MCFVFHYPCYHKHSTCFKLKLINLQAQTLPLHLFTIVLCVYYRRDGDNEEDIEILDLSHLINDYYFSIAVKNLVPRAFFKTQSYMSVLDSMAEGRTCITGPKGVGKTMCLLALLCKLREQGFEPVFITSHSFESEEITLNYLQEVAKNIGFEKRLDSTFPLCYWLSCLINFTNPSRKPVLLLDFDKLNDSSILFHMAAAARCCRDNTVLAVSSGDCVVKNQSFKSLFQYFRVLNYLPFTEREASYFIKYHKIGFTADELRPVTGCNPLLLALASNATNLPGVIQQVDGYIKSYIEENLICGSLPVQFLNSLKRCEEYFWMAFINDTLQTHDDIVDFNSSWVGLHRVCYLEHNVIKLNFPRLPGILQADLRDLVNKGDIDITVYPQVKGLMAEELFFQHANEGVIVVTNKSTSIKFTVNQVQKMPRNKDNLKENVLYRLEMYHPVIDAVGLFVQDQGIICLVYFQVSISSYDAHKKKIGDLFADNHNNNKYPELTSDCKSLHDYYKSKAARDYHHVYYVYISTETTISCLGSHIEADANRNGVSYAVLSTEDLLYSKIKLS